MTQRFSFAIAALIGMTAPIHAQQPAPAAPPPPASTSGTQTSSPPPAPAASPPVTTTFTTTTAPSDATIPSPDTVKKAKQAGYHPKLRKGVTVFCKEETEIGSHFSSENCINEQQLNLALERQQAQRDQMTNHTCTGCSGK